jgi:hypothetical protein
VLKTSGPQRDEIMGGLRKLHNEGLHNLYCLPNIIRMLKPRRIRQAENVAHMQKRTAYGFQ